MMGRGMRLHEGKNECLVLDYAENLERHMPDGDLYRPEIKAAYQGETVLMDVKCDLCSRINVFSARPNPEGYGVSDNGYFLDLAGNLVMVEANDEMKPMPAHFGRRCQHVDKKNNRCENYWSSKICDVCEHHNDIAARFCGGCKAELVNPNDRLISLHKQHKKDPTRPQCDELLEIDHWAGLNRSGNDMVKVELTTSRRKFKIYLLEHSDFLARKKMAIMNATANLTHKPRTVSYVKNGDFWEVLGFDEPTDDEKLQEKIA
jgi:DNA repair protein RadD